MVNDHTNCHIEFCSLRRTVCWAGLKTQAVTLLVTIGSTAMSHLIWTHLRTFTTWPARLIMGWPFCPSLEKEQLVILRYIKLHIQKPSTFIQNAQFSCAIDFLSKTNTDWFIIAIVHFWTKKYSNIFLYFNMGNKI